MSRRTGSADLPLHGGRVPAWLARRMERLGRVVCEAILLEYGRDELLRRLAHPFWFQSFGAVMGMDWHSSGITTSVIGALKRGLAPVSSELGLHVCGGRGRHSRRTPDELRAIGERTGLDGDALARTSRLVAKVDSAAVQDGFDLYLHGFVVTDDGHWVVVQQGMCAERREARRYHWLSEGLESFVDQPHAAIEGEGRGEIVNLTDARAAASRDGQLALLARGPTELVHRYERILRGASGAQAHPARTQLALPNLDVPQPEVPRADSAPAPLPHLQMPHRHDVRASDVVLRRLHGALAAAESAAPRDFPELLLTPGFGARSVFALALVSEVVFGAPCRFSDPARFSLALGGKDGHPFPVPLHVYDETLGVLRAAFERARLGQDDRLAAMRRLDGASRALEHDTGGPAFEAFVASERRQSHQVGGRTVAGSGRPAKSRAAVRNQLQLPGT